MEESKNKAFEPADIRSGEIAKAAILLHINQTNGMHDALNDCFTWDEDEAHDDHVYRNRLWRDAESAVIAMMTNTTSTREEEARHVERVLTEWYDRLYDDPTWNPPEEI